MSARGAVAYCLWQTYPSHDDAEARAGADALLNRVSAEVLRDAANDADHLAAYLHDDMGAKAAEGARKVIDLLRERANWLEKGGMP